MFNVCDNDAIATSAQKMATVCFSETLASTDESTRRQNPEEQHQHHPHPREEKTLHTVRLLESLCMRRAKLLY
jgi:hypothetical protein